MRAPFTKASAPRKPSPYRERFEFYYTPKSGSWLNMIEIEFSALSKQCLNRRIASKEELSQDVRSGCQRARGESHQDRLAILHYLSEEQVKQALSASSC